MANNLAFIGTVHFDPAGKKRLEKLLDHLNPDIITLEYSPEREKEKRELYESMLDILREKCVDEETIGRFPAPSFYELDVCQNYSQEKEIPCFHIDMDTFGTKALLSEERQKFLKKIQKKSKGKIKREIRKKPKKRRILQKIVDSIYYNELKISVMNRLMPIGILGARDRYMAEAINNLLEVYPDKKIVHVGGFAHLVNPVTNFWITNLGTIFPETKKYTLLQADSL